MEPEGGEEVRMFLILAHLEAEGGDFEGKDLTG